MQTTVISAAKARSDAHAEPVMFYNKWPMRVKVERNGKTFTVNSYSLLQDRYYEHMRAAASMYGAGARAMWWSALCSVSFLCQEKTYHYSSLYYFYRSGKHVLSYLRRYIILNVG